MPALADVTGRTALQRADLDHLHVLVGDWQLVADLSFADLVLWVRSTAGQWLAAAHVRPTTGVGAFNEDLVGRQIDASRRGFVETAYRERRIVRSPRTMWRDDVPVREESIPVVRGGEVIAVISRHTNLASMRTPSRLEVTYLASADALCRMIMRGDFPVTAPNAGPVRGTPRVGDGVMRLDAAGRIGFASPNAVSALHRLGYDGEVVGARLTDLLAGTLRSDPDHRGNTPAVIEALTTGTPQLGEIVNRGTYVSLRSVPLSEEGNPVGSLVLVRDVSELRRRELELLTKDATIREIHHRVKNNLQTVAAVLRLQARRVDDASARSALEDAVRRVATIADVHQTLSMRLDGDVDFDEIARRGTAAAIEVGNRSQVQVVGQVTGSFGRLNAEDATAVAMILAELGQNAVEHAFADRGGLLEVHADRRHEDGRDRLEVQVSDDGAGLPADFDPQQGGLGTQIVQSFVQNLGGAISWNRRTPQGTVVRFHVQLGE